VALGRPYLFPPLSSGGALVARPWLRFHTPLIEPDMQISRIKCGAPHLMPYVAPGFRVRSRGGILRPDRQRTVSAARHRKMLAFANTINSFSIHPHGIPALTQDSSTSTNFSCESGGVVRLPGAQAQRTVG
jgi:hypothetical protein